MPRPATGGGMKPGGGAPGPPGMKGGGGMPAEKVSMRIHVCKDICTCGRELGQRRTREPKRRRREPLPWDADRGTALRGREHGVGARLALGGVGRGDGVDDRLGFFVADFCERGKCVSQC